MLTFHELQLEINRLEAKERRQHLNLEQTRKLIMSLRNLQLEKNDAPVKPTRGAKD